MSPSLALRNEPVIAESLSTQSRITIKHQHRERAVVKKAIVEGNLSNNSPLATGLKTKAKKFDPTKILAMIDGMVKVG